MRFRTGLAIAAVIFGVTKLSFAQPFITQASIWLGEVAVNLTLGAPLSVSSTGKIISGIQYYSTGLLTSNPTITNGSGTVIITSTTLNSPNPAAGTYLVLFLCTVQTTTGGNSITTYIYNGTSPSGYSFNIQFPTATLIDSGYPLTLAAIGIVTMNGSTALNEYWSTSGGTATMQNRVLIAVRLN